MDTFNERGAGRRPIPLHKKRLSCHEIRLEAWWKHWLKNHPGSGGRLIEVALEEHYQPDKARAIREFYESIEGGCSD